MSLYLEYPPLQIVATTAEANGNLVVGHSTSRIDAASAEHPAENVSFLTNYCHKSTFLCHLFMAHLKES